MGTISIALACTALLLLVLIRRAFRRRTLGNLRGPASASVLFGNEHQIFHQKEVGELDFRWIGEFGLTWRVRGYFGVEQLMTADPKALQHILHKSGYNYPKRVDINHLTYLTLGPGILSSEGDVHRRHRKVMSPAFSAPQLKMFVPLFQKVAEKVADKWKAEVKDNSGAEILVDKWLARATLDVIGEAAFDFQFGALDDAENPLAKEYSTLFRDSSVYPSSRTLLWRATWPYLPDPLLMLTKYVPTTFYKRLRALNDMFADIGRPLYKSIANEWDGSRSEKRDALSVLTKANLSESTNARLTEGEVLAEMHSLTVAGHETTSNTLTWMLYELAQRPQFQARIRAEIRAARAAVIERGDYAFSLEDLDGMKVVLATIKETLRFHPILYNMQRVAAKDDVIPLSDPVIGKNGETITELPISAGQPVVLSVCGYNRLREVWGADADQWNPERFLGLDQEKQIKVGVYANLLTFSAGLRACIGWRFALYELQVLASELIEKFEFSLPKDKPRITRCPGGIMLPLVHKKTGEAVPAMPLHISIAV